MQIVKNFIQECCSHVQRILNVGADVQSTISPISEIALNIFWFPNVNSCPYILVLVPLLPISVPNNNSDDDDS